jgi:hypothetical protein
MKTAPKPIISEEKIQQQIVMFYHNTYCLPNHTPRCMILSIPNEKKPEMVRTGLYAGAADLLVIHYGKTAFVEVKNEIGKQSDKQKAFEKHCKDMGTPYFLVRNLEEFLCILKQME